MNNIKSFVLFLMLLPLSSVANEQSKVILPINNMFDAMREHNGEKFLVQFTEGAILERATNSNDIKQSELLKFAEFITASNKHLDEKLFNITIQESGNLASAWTPFAFYIDGKLSHCGINSFQLIKQDNQWKIRYLIDNAYQGDCLQFIKIHKAEL